MNTTRTLSESQPLNLRVSEPEYKIDLSDARCKGNLSDSAEYLKTDYPLP